MQSTTIVSEHHNPRTSKSPIRKQLVKKLVTYYNQLDDIRSKSPRRKRQSKNRKHYLNNSIMNPKRKNRKTAPKRTDYYFDPKMRKRQLEELRDLMYSELHRAKVEDSLAHDDIDIYESMTGYPSFVRETTDALKMKHQMRKEPWDSRNSDFRPPVHKVLEEKVYHSQIHADPNERDPAPISVNRVTRSHYKTPGGVRTTTTVSHPVYDNKLYHLNTSRKILSGNSAEYDQLDWHERKAKEIRRLQYVADWEARRKRKRSRTPVKRRKWKVVKFRELADVLAKEQLDREEKIRRILELERLLCDEFNSVDLNVKVKRSDPSNAHPIWIQLGGSCYPGRILCPLGFKISKYTNTFEVREGDEVIIHANELEGSEYAPKGFVAQGLPKSFIGIVRKPKQMDFQLCENAPDFVIEEPTGERYPILLNRPFIVKKTITSAPVMPVTNCNIYNRNKDFIGRGNLRLTEGLRDNFLFKGIMIDQDNLVQYVLLNRDGPASIVYKGADGQRRLGVLAREESVIFEQFGTPVQSTVTNVHYDAFNNKTTTVENVTSYPAGVRVLILTLKENDLTRPPRVIYFIGERPISVESRHCLLDGEEATLECEDLNTYQGRLEIDRADNVFLRAYPCQENNFTDQEVLHLELNQPEPNPFDISHLQDKIQFLAEERANLSISQVNVGVVDNRGNQMNITVNSEPNGRKRRTVTQRRLNSGMNSSRVSLHSHPVTRNEILKSIETKIADIQMSPRSSVKKTTYVHSRPSPMRQTVVTESFTEEPRRAPKPRRMNRKKIVNRKLFETPGKVTEIEENVNIVPRRPKVTQEVTTTSYKPDRHSLHKTTKTTTKVKPQPPKIYVDRRVKTSHIPRPRAHTQVTSYSHNHTFGRSEGPIIEQQITEEEIMVKKPKRRGNVKIDVDVENEENVDIRVTSRSPSPRRGQVVKRTTTRTSAPQNPAITVHEEHITNPITGAQKIITTTKKSPQSNRNTHYTEHSYVEESSVSPFKSPGSKKVTTYYQNGRNRPVVVKETHIADSAAKKIQKEWRHFQWKKDYSGSEDSDDGIYETIHHDEKLETLRETLGNDQDFARFLNFYKTLPQDVDYEKAYQLFQNMMNQLMY